MKMFFILLGPHGAGKGTQADLISKRYSIPKISTGDIFRDMIKHPENVSYVSAVLIKTVKAVYPNYIDDKITNEIVRVRLAENDCKNGFILDGYPRTLDQAEFLDGLSKHLGFKKYAAINLQVNGSTLVKRQLNRLVCENEKCGASYNALFNPPKVGGVCDRCGSRLRKRSEDTEKGIIKRNKEYEEKARPVVDYYRKKGFVIDIDGNKAPLEVFQDVKKSLDNEIKS